MLSSASATGSAERRESSNLAQLRRLRKEERMINPRTTIATVALAMLFLSACKVGPNYKRPSLDVPGDYRGVAPMPDTQQPQATPPAPAPPAPTETQSAQAAQQPVPIPA